MNTDIKGKIVLVTGAAEGLGYSMVDNFLKNGAKLAIILDINEKKGLEASETFKTKYGDEKSVFYKCDVTKDLEDIYGKVIETYKYVDVLINNAGVLAEKNYNKTIDINLTSVIAWSMKFFDNMRLDKGGKGGTIINVSSIYGYRILPFIPYYHASKFGVLGFSKSLGYESTYKRTGVRVVTLCPGLTRTSICTNVFIREDELVKFLEELEQGIWQFPEDIGRGTFEIFQQAESGSVWLVEGGKAAEKINI